MSFFKWNGGNVFEQLDTLEPIIDQRFENGSLGDDDVDMSIRVMPRVKCKKADWRISIQGCYHCYCIPKEYVKFVDYLFIEIAISYKGSIRTEKILADLIEDELLLTKIEYFRDGVIYPYVPVELVQRLVEQLC